MKFYHGTMAFGTIVEDYVNGPTVAIQRIQKLVNHPEWEVCCSNEALGHIGVVLDGTAIAMFSGDVSSIVVNGHRVRSADYGTHYQEITAEEWDTCSSSKTHTEAWVTNYTVVSIWISNDFAWENEELLPMLEDIGLPIDIIER